MNEEAVLQLYKTLRPMPMINGPYKMSVVTASCGCIGLYCMPGTAPLALLLRCRKCEIAGVGDNLSV